MSVDFKDLLKFQKELTAQEKKANDFANKTVRNLAGRLLGYVYDETPVLKTPTPANKGGTLRRGWTAKTHEQAKAGQSSPMAQYIAECPITVKGNVLTIDIINPVEYAMYVEYGHRLRNGGFYPGVFMLQRSIDKLTPQVDKITDKLLNDFLKAKL